jgi:DNA-binding CsgD family transcriptional regulator
VATSTALLGALARIERICASDGDARALRLSLLAEIRRAVGFDAYAWVLTDPETTVGASPLADVPCLPELPRLVRLRYLTPINRWTTLTGAPVALLGVATGGELSASLLWRELLLHHEVSDVASVVFRDQWGCWAFLELWRRDATRFTAAEERFLGALVPPVTAALRRCQLVSFEPAGATRPRPPGPLVLLLSPDLDVLRATAGTQDPLRLLVPRDDGQAPVPAGAYNVAAQLLAVEAGVDEHPPTARVHLAEGLWLTLRAARLDTAGPLRERDIVVTIEASTATERIALFARAAGLTDRETQVLGHVASGADTRDVARRMTLSALTVQDHLKSVFAKTGTHSRGALLARALGA